MNENNHTLEAMSTPEEMNPGELLLATYQTLLANETQLPPHLRHIVQQQEKLWDLAIQLCSPPQHEIPEDKGWFIGLGSKS